MAKSPPTLLFGKPSNKFTIDLIKRILGALNKRSLPGQFQGRKRNDLFERLQTVEKELSEVERHSVAYLLRHDLAITPNTFLEEVKKLVKKKPELECDICAEVKATTSFPTEKVTPGCDHITPICRTCLTEDINTQLTSNDWQGLKCLVCTSPLPTDTVKQYTTPPVFERYREFMMIYQLRDLPDFRWCQSPGCGSGQVHPKTSREPNGRTTCYKCGESGCFKCSNVWHEGQRCDKAQQERIQALPLDDQTDMVISSTTNTCPQCNAKIQKAGGCNHMSCRCGYLFNWTTPKANQAALAQKFKGDFLAQLPQNPGATEQAPINTAETSGMNLGGFLQEQSQVDQQILGEGEYT